MRPELENIPLIKNEERKRFEIEIEGHYAFINYKEDGHQITLVHTETDPKLSGKGTTTAVLEKILLYLKNNKLSFTPFCPFVFTYIKKHPEWKYLVDKEFSGYNNL